MQPVAVDDKSPSVKLFEVDVAGGDAAGGQVRGGEANGLGLVDGGGTGVREPGVELREGGRGKLGAGEGAFGVLVCLGIGVRAGRGDCEGRG